MVGYLMNLMIDWQLNSLLNWSLNSLLFDVMVELLIYCFFWLDDYIV